MPRTIWCVEEGCVYPDSECLGKCMGGSKRREKVMTTTIDMVNQPPHYKQGDIECIDAIKAALTEEEFRGYCKGNVIKYTWRERHKGNVESLEKARYYLNKLIDVMRGKV